MKQGYIPLLVCLAGSLLLPLQAAETVTVRIERAPTINGPWLRIDLGTAVLDGDGNPRLPFNTTNEFFRTRLELGPATGLGDRIPLTDVPTLTRNHAQELLTKRMQLDPEDEGWPEGAELAPDVLPMHTISRDGVQPTYFEFKVIKRAKPPLRTGPLATHPEDYILQDCGYLLLGATTDDFPVCEFATEGPTLSETLARAAKTSRIRVVRYGPGLAVAEDERGRILASLGSVPFKMDPKVFDLDGLEWTGSDTNRTDVSPRIVPDLKVEGYPDYAAFKKDFAENDTYEKMRQIKRARAKLEWDILNGNPPPGLTVAVGQTVQVFSDLPLNPLPEVLLVSEVDSLLRMSVSSTGGIRVTGAAVGHGLLRARVAGQERVLTVRVNSPAGPQNLPTLIESATFYAGNWDAQPKYHQFEDSDWCPVVGCGPVAWAMLFAWFDRQWGVEYAFNGEGSGNPPSNTSSSANRSKVRPAYRALHELCDVICAAGSGATWPPDMTDGFKGYTYIPALADQIYREWHINAVTGTWPDAGALRCRDAIKNGYPAVVGLGWMWHYALAYGYAYEVYDLGVGYTATIRYLKCNMGWGPNVSPRWYNLGDTFYAANVKIWRGPNG
jgi:hypothetical protein